MSGETPDVYDAVVVGGGPAGATAARRLALDGRDVMLLDKDGRIKPCGGAVPPRILDQFEVPESQLVNKVDTARVVSPSGESVDIPVGDGFVGMVDRGPFDEWLRQRAARDGADRRVGTYKRLTRPDANRVRVHFADGPTRNATESHVDARIVVGADGALSSVAREEVPGADEARYVFAYHEIIHSPDEETVRDSRFGPRRCDVFYNGDLSPDFYAWIFPHGDETSVGMGTMQKGFGMREAVDRLRAATGLDDAETIREEGAPIPLKMLPRWENGRDVVLAGDAAGVVAPASGEGIYYAMASGAEVARAVGEALDSGDPDRLSRARKRFRKTHGGALAVLKLMQRTWYRDDRRRESFVDICRDPDVQTLTFEGYMHKELVKARPLAHARIFFKNLGHLLGLLRPSSNPVADGLDYGEVMEATSPATPESEAA